MLPILLAQADTAIPEPTVSIDFGQLDTAAKAAGTGLAAVGIGLIIMWIVAVVIGLAFLIWWIVLLVDLTKRDFPQKNVYLILMIVSFFLGFLWLMDLIYYFAIVRPNIGTKKV